jgi:predicted ester cyclase
MSYRRIKWMLSFSFLIVALSIFPVVGTAQDDPTEARKTLIQQFNEQALNAGDLDMMDDVYAADYVNHGFTEDLDLEGYKAMIDAWRAAMPDFSSTVEVLIAEGEFAASRVRYSGTVENEWQMGETVIAPTGETVEWTLNIMHRFNEDNQIVEDFTAFDLLDLLTQLDAAPLPDLITEALDLRENTPIVMEEVVEPISEEMLITQADAFIHIIEDAINDGDLTAIDTYMAEDYQAHEPFGEFTRQEFRDIIETFRAVVPDLHVDIEALVVEDDWLAARLIYIGTFANGMETPILPIPANNQEIRFIINVFVHFEEGIPVEDFKEYNRLGWLQQLGVTMTSS